MTRLLIAAWLLAYLAACVLIPEPDTCPDGTPPTEACGCLPPTYGTDC